MQTRASHRHATRQRPAQRGLPTYVLLAFIAAATGLAYYLTSSQTPASVTGRARVIDGDSLAVGGVEVRLHGIDAPELFQRCLRAGRDVQCGREALRHLVALIAGQPVTCERRDIDRFGRMVATCRIDGVDLGRAMVAAGHAVSYGAYVADEAAARSERRGLWGGEFTPPRQWRDQQRARPGPGA
ncbi:thermonuclease family protein [Phreatobacter sp.]|uniref:thermonuclease family protein n=1 Tax=Phreatobacter sp. TaxID=1966341 RepID=UPI003F71193B